MNDMNGCPWPERPQHATKRAAFLAIEAIGSTGRGGVARTPYPCGDHWHVGLKSRTHRTPKRRRKAAARTRRSAQ